MTKLVLRVKALSAIALCCAVAAACGNGEDDSTGGDGDGDGDNVVIPGTGGTPVVATGGSTGTGGTPIATGGSTAVSPCEGLAVVGGTDPLIDDFEHTDTASLPDPAVDNRVGSWYTSNDGSPGGVQTPPAAMAFPTAGVGHNDSAGLHSTATGYGEWGDPNKDWGANFGVSLNDNGGNGCAYDASAFEGISFWAKSGDGGTHTLNVGVPIPAIIPIARGGTCAGVGCDDTHVTPVTIGPEWALHTFTWSQFMQNAGWAHENKYPFDSQNIAQISFSIGGVVGAYDVIIDDLMFTGEGIGVGGAQ